MESKLTIHGFHACDAVLLIEPVWNRNERDNAELVAQAKLLIEPVWNRNLSYANLLCPTSHAFNRTSMESKPRPRRRCSSSWAPFNRTSMESKLKLTKFLTRKLWTFNRTSMESKRKQSMALAGAEAETFNRTSMESKLWRNIKLFFKRRFL